VTKAIGHIAPRPSGLRCKPRAFRREGKHAHQGNHDAAARIGRPGRHRRGWCRRRHRVARTGGRNELQDALPERRLVDGHQPAHERADPNGDKLMSKAGSTTTIFAIILNTVFPGFGYLYIRERIPLAIFLCISTTYEWIYNIGVLLSPTPHTPYALHLSPFFSIPGLITIIGMGVDVYFLMKRQGDKATRTRQTAR
jgi:hypothetical protein